MKQLFIIRGLPGSGKSKFAREIADNVFEADDFFTNKKGKYKFDKNLLKKAHEECLVNTVEAMKLCCDKIAVANTFTQAWEMEAYIQMAEIHGYTIHTIIVENRHGGENIHNVPESTIQKMEKRFQIHL